MTMMSCTRSVANFGCRGRACRLHAARLVGPTSQHSGFAPCLTRHAFANAESRKEKSRNITRQKKETWSSERDSVALVRWRNAARNTRCYCTVVLLSQGGLHGKTGPQSLLCDMLALPRAAPS